MNPRLAAIPAVLATLAVAAGGAGGAGAQPLPAGHDPHIADGTLQHKLDAARKTWKAAHVSSYRYEIQVSCFCPPATKPNVFTVRKGAPAKYPSGYKSLASVPRLFKTIQGAIDDDVANLNVTYGKRGVPTSIYIDRSQQIADEEQGYTVKHFTRLR